MSKSLKDDYETSKEYSKDIIMNISSILDNNNIQYTMNKKCTEIVIDSNHNIKFRH